MSATATQGQGAIYERFAPAKFDHPAFEAPWGMLDKVTLLMEQLGWLDMPARAINESAYQCRFYFSVAEPARFIQIASTSVQPDGRVVPENHLALNVPEHQIGNIIDEIYTFVRTVLGIEPLPPTSGGQGKVFICIPDLLNFQLEIVTNNK